MNNQNNDAKQQNPQDRTDVLENVSRETNKKPDIYEEQKQKKAELDVVRRKGSISDDNPFDNNNPTYKELYRSFRANNLSVTESCYNALYLRCYDNYYSSGVPVKNKYKNIYAHPSAWFKNAHHMWKHNKWSVAVKLLEIIPATKRFFTKIGNGWKSIKGSFRNTFGSGHSLRIAVGTLVATAAVVGSVTLVGMGAAQYSDNMKKIPAFKLYINGNYEGDILSITEAQDAKMAIEQSVSSSCKTHYDFEHEITFEPTKIKKGSNLTKAGVTQVFREVAHGEMKHGYGLILYDTLLVVVEDKAWLKDSIDEITSVYIAQELISSGEITTDATVGGDLRIVEGNYLEEQFSTYDEVRAMFSLGTEETKGSETILVNEQVPENITTVDKTPVTLPGSSPGTATDIGANDDTEALEHIIPLKQTKTTIQTIEEYTPFDETIRYDDTLPITRRIITRPGKKGLRIAIYNVEMDGDNELSRELIEEREISQPVTQLVTQGTRPLTEYEEQTKSYGQYIIPSVGSITSYYGWRSWGDYNEFHKGVDFDDNRGTKIVAADGGVVIQARDKDNGYGLCILIEHDDGTRTRYAHCSMIHVAEGDRVAQGEHIGEIGATGWVTGSHLHFEIIKGGQTVDPADYIPI